MERLWVRKGKTRRKARAMTPRVVFGGPEGSTGSGSGRIGPKDQPEGKGLVGLVGVKPKPKKQAER